MSIGSRSSRSRAGRAHRPRAVLLAVAVIAGLVLGAAGPALAEPLPKTVTWTAVINDRNIDRGNAQVTLDPSKPAQVTVAVNNRGQKPVTIQYVRMEGSFLGLSFYVYTTYVAREVAGGATENIEFEVDLLDLGDQATGLLPSRIVLLDKAGDEMAAKDFQADVQGELSSVYGVFGVAVGALTLVLLFSALFRLATGRLHRNRWRRGLTMAAPGLGLGFFLTFSLSALHVASPRAALWAPLLLAGAAIGFIAGYLSPNPEEPEEYADEGEEPPDDSIDLVSGTAPGWGDGEGAATEPERPLPGR